MLAASMFRTPTKGRPLIRQSHRREKARTARGECRALLLGIAGVADGATAENSRERPDEGRGNAMDRARGIHAKISCQLRIPTKPRPIFKNMSKRKPASP